MEREKEMLLISKRQFLTKQQQFDKNIGRTNTFDFVMSAINNFTGDRNGTLVAFVKKDFHNIEKITCENLGN